MQNYIIIIATNTQVHLVKNTAPSKYYATLGRKIQLGHANENSNPSFSLVLLAKITRLPVSYVLEQHSGILPNPPVRQVC